MNKTNIEILLAEDNEDEIILIEEALNDANIHNVTLNYVNNGIETLKYLKQEPPYQSKIRPDLLLLDLNMPQMNGHEVLHEIKNNADLKTLPVIILSNSQNEQDIIKSYENHANCYISKPSDYHAFKEVLKLIEEHWLKLAKLPRKAFIE